MATIIPVFRYDDARAAIAFLQEAFGFTEHAVYEEGGVVHHAELRLGEAYIMSCVEGETLGRRIVRDGGLATARAGLARRCGEVMAAIHSIPVGALPHLEDLAGHLPNALRDGPAMHRLNGNHCKNEKV